MQNPRRIPHISVCEHIPLCIRGNWHMPHSPDDNRSKAERRQALAAAAVATHTASLSNDLQHVGRRQSLPRSRANVALVLPATFYTSEKATQLLFSLTQRGVATRRCSCTAASDVAQFLADHEGIAVSQ